MRKRMLVTVSMAGMVALTCLAGNKAGNRERKTMSSQVERLGKELKLSPEQMTQLQKVNYDFRAEQKKQSSAFKKDHAKRQQATMKAMRKDAQKLQKNQAKVQRDYLKSVKKVMNQDQYVAFLENYFVKQHAVAQRNFSKSPRRGERPMAHIKKKGERGLRDGMQKPKRNSPSAPAKDSQD